jgi:hypothetical protein
MSKIFISHASEDKEAVAMPLAELLRRRGLDVWLDQWELTLGDSLRDTIEKAISQAAFGVVIVSPDYLRKPWPNRELDGFFSLETQEKKLILPVLHNIGHDELPRRWPMLSGRLSCSTDRGLEVVADQIVAAVHKSSEDQRMEKPPDAVLSEYRRRMLSAVDRRDLRQLFYELEDFLHHFPAHPQARLLRDELISAIQYEGMTWSRRRLPVPTLGARMWPRLLQAAVISASLGVVLYLLYKLVRYLMGL